MSLDVWFQQDFRNTLLALHCAQAAQPARPEAVEINASSECDAYRAGFQAALQSVALAFGIALEQRRPLAAKRDGRPRLRLAEPTEPYVTGLSGASEAMYE
jgi:hypothetical protein